MIWAPSLFALVAGDRVIMAEGDMGAADWRTFPLAIVPQGLVWLLGGHLSPVMHRVLFIGLMSAALFLTMQLVDLMGPRLRIRGGGLTWLLITAPLFPLVINRQDPWPVLLATAAMAATIGRRDRHAPLLQLGAVLTQGWPAVLAAPDWLRGNRARAGLIVGVAGLVGALVVSNPAFDLQLRPETLLGGLLSFLGSLRGQPVDLGQASPAALVQINLGLLLAALALVRLDRNSGQRADIRLVAALLLAGLVASPALPATALLLATPFLALHPSRTIRRSALSVTSLTLLLVMGPDPSLERSVGWLALLNVRNLLFLGMAVMTAWAVTERVWIARPRPAARPSMEKAYGLLAIFSATVIGSWLLLAASHVGDFYKVDHASRARMAFAQYAREGVLFPPVFDGVRFGGTRWMPAPFVIHAAASRLTGEYLVSGKLLTYLSVAALAALVTVILRRKGCPWPVVGGMVGLLLVTPAGLMTTLGVRWDVLPIVPQLAALALVAEIPDQEPRGADRRLLLAAVLCVIAFTIKVTALWAALAIVGWLLLRDRRRAVIFAGTWGILLLAFLVGLHISTEGRMLENFREVSGAGMDGLLRSVARAPYRFVQYNMRTNLAVWFLLPLPLFVAVKAVAQRRFSLYQAGLVVTFAMALVLMADSGIAENHFLDFMVLMAPVLAEIWEANAVSAYQTVKIPRVGSFSVRSLVVAALVWALLIGYLPTAAPQDWPGRSSLGADIGRVLTARRTDKGSFESHDQFRAHVHPGDRVLSEDPYVDVAFGRHPIVVDSWIMAHFAENHPDWIAELVQRIEEGEFDKVVLLAPLENSDYYKEYLGPTVAQAIASNYMLCQSAFERHFYVPKDTASTVACSVFDAGEGAE